MSAPEFGFDSLPIKNNNNIYTSKKGNSAPIDPDFPQKNGTEIGEALNGQNDKTTPFDDYTRKFLEMEFDDIDTNKDGIMSYNEFLDYSGAKGTKNEKSIRLYFEQFIKDGLNIIIKDHDTIILGGLEKKDWVDVNIKHSAPGNGDFYNYEMDFNE